MKGDFDAMLTVIAEHLHANEKSTRRRILSELGITEMPDKRFFHELPDDDQVNYKVQATTLFTVIATAASMIQK